MATSSSQRLCFFLEPNILSLCISICVRSVLFTKSSGENREEEENLNCKNYHMPRAKKKSARENIERHKGPSIRNPYRISVKASERQYIRTKCGKMQTKGKVPLTHTNTHSQSACKTYSQRDIHVYEEKGRERHTNSRLNICCAEMQNDPFMAPSQTSHRG